MSHVDRAHATLGASSAYRWMNCPGSARLSEGIERKSSVYADEGTAAHMLAEWCLSQGAAVQPFTGRVIDINGADHKSQFLPAGSELTEGRFEVDDEMVDAVTMFVEAVRAAMGPNDELGVENRVSLADDMFGTADAMIWSPRRRKVFVFDLKYGAGVAVEVKDNPQIIYYAEGVLRALPNAAADEIEVTIVQPRCPHPDGPIRSATIDALQMIDWSIEIAAAADAARQPDAPLKAGDWCKWCPAAGACPELAAKALAVAQTDFDDLDTITSEPYRLPPPDRISPMQRAKVLDSLDLLEEWAKAVRQFAYAEAEAGRSTPGYKLVNKVGRRKWNDEDQAAKTVITELKLTAKDIFAAPKLKSPAQIEKLVGKKDFAAVCAALCPAISSGTTLVPNNDKRPAVVRGIESEFDVLEDIIGA